MKMKADDLISALEADVRQLILAAEYLKAEETGTLTRQPGSGKWSVAQVLAHLNMYGDYYLPAIEKSMAESTKMPAVWFRPGWAGNYFTRIMRPGTDGSITSKMKSPKDHRPAFIADARHTIHTFIGQQHRLLQLLAGARQKNIGNIRTPVSISRFIRLKTGDTFRFLIAHEQRHFVQIKNILAQVKAVAVADARRPVAAGAI